MRSLKLALVQSEVQLVLLETFHDDVGDATVFLECVHVDEDVVKVYAHNAFSDEVTEDVFHHCLERRWAVC